MTKPFEVRIQLFHLISEYWRNGGTVEGLISSFSVLQHSITPALIDRDFRKLLAILNHLNYVHRPVKYDIDIGFSIRLTKL